MLHYYHDEHELRASKFGVGEFVAQKYGSRCVCSCNDTVGSFPFRARLCETF